MYRTRDTVWGLASVVGFAVVGALVAVPALAAPSAARTAAPSAAQTAAQTAAPSAAPTVDPAVWAACPDDVADALGQLQCASIPVPLDYTAPDGVKIEIVVSRLASLAPRDRRGVLLLNPGGGPGESGLTQPLDLVAKGLPVSVSDAYDLIGVDTRGIGHSAPISCGFTVEQGYTGAIPRYAADGAAVEAEGEVVRAVAEQCAANDRDGSLRHISTANMARDMDQVRAALGEEKISYYGVSYGTALGAAYSSMFPDRTDRIVLDSAIGDTHLDQDGMRRYGRGAEETFPDFVKWAAQRDGTYGLGDTEAEVRKSYFALAQQLDEHPLDDGLLDGHLFRLATYVSLYGESLYAGTAQLWQYALRSDEAGLESRLDELVPTAPRVDAASATPSPSDNSFSVFLAVTCNDTQFSGDVAVYKRAVAHDRERYPVFGAATANIMPCAFWPYEQVEPPVAVDDDGPENILILQHRRDPPTPYIGGVMLHEKFEKRSTLVSVEGSGHGVYIYGDSACADNTATTFLVDGTMPAEDTGC